MASLVDTYPDARLAGTAAGGNCALKGQAPDPERKKRIFLFSLDICRGKGDNK